MKKFLLFIIFLCIWISLLQADERLLAIDSISIKGGALVIDLHAEKIFDDKMIQGLNRGLTSTFQYEIQLWEKRSIWVNSLVTTETRKIKVYFDNWEKKYVIISPEEKRLTSSLETVQKICTLVSDFILFPASKLKEKKKYFIAVKLVQKPLSMENYREIKNWLSGSAKNLDLKNLDDSEEQERKIKGGFLKLLLSITGFGDKIISGKSKIFRVQQNKIVFEK